MDGMADERTFVIVGAGLAGAKAAETLRAEGFAGRVVLVGEETDRPYERPPLSKGYLIGKQARDQAFVHEATWYADHDVELVLGVRATALDPARHTVTLDGVEPLHYDKLLLATGCRVRTLGVPGAELTAVRYLRTFTEADSLLDHLPRSRRVVIVGAGWIGLETAAAARSYGAEVTVVARDPLPLRRVLGDELAGMYADLHRANGVEFRVGVEVTGFADSGGQLTAVRLADGTDLSADLAIVGIGVRPSAELAENAGLAVDDGSVVDAGLRTSDPDIYACGDVASADNPLLGRRIRVEHWANALDGGPAAAKAMLGRPVVFDNLPYFYSDQYDVGMEYSGWVEPGGYDRVVFRGDVPGREFIAFWVSGGRVLAGMNVNVWDVQDQLRPLIRAGFAGTAVDPVRLADPGVALDELV
jgi:3-phenylpropionate/trans-cinnamate dioxygenase ferredoxin reductase subunit